MAGYKPLRITGNSAGLVESREEFLLPNDAYPVLQNAYVWRERIRRKQGCTLLGRLQRNIGTTNGAGNLVVVITPNPVISGVSQFTVGSDIFTDPGGASPVALLTNSSGSATLNRATGQLSITGSQANTSVQYFPGLPVMGICLRELQDSSNYQSVIFDPNYAYIFNASSGQFEEFIPGTTWNASNAGVSNINFFFSTNYWISSNPPFTTSNRKLFWVTNNTGSQGANADPPRITDGTTWVDFDSSTWNQIDSTTYLFNFLAMLPFRGRMVTFNTWEGTTKGGAANFSNRIRWATIGNPFIPYSAGPPAVGSWRDDIRGQGGFLDIPTSEDIVSVGFVRDNLVVYCERSTWQLRYTGRSIAPFQIERVNSELGVDSTFASVQFDTSLVAVGDKGLIECDSYKAERIDIKIPDFVFQINYLNNGVKRVQGVRDFINRLAYWTIPQVQSYDADVPSAAWIFPNQRLVYNYENDSWALFNDSFTALGTYQEQVSRKWINIHQPWISCNFNWISQPQGDPQIIGGNQQGFVEILNANRTTNDVSLFITNIQGNSATDEPTVVFSPNHNMQNNFVIGISRIIGNYSNLNGEVFGIALGDNTDSNTENCFRLYTYNSSSENFDTPQLDASATYQGGGLINIRDNFSIVSKKFNFLDEGESIQLGYVDILMESSGTSNPGAISLYVYLDYDDVNATNILPNNQVNNGNSPVISDTFFNSVIPTSPSNLAAARQGTKFWQRAFCATRGNFLTIKYTLSNAQMAGIEQELDVQIDAQVLWVRKAGRMTSV